MHAWLRENNAKTTQSVMRLENVIIDKETHICEFHHTISETSQCTKVWTNIFITKGLTKIFIPRGLTKIMITKVLIEINMTRIRNKILKPGIAEEQCEFVDDNAVYEKRKVTCMLTTLTERAM